VTPGWIFQAKNKTTMTTHEKHLQLVRRASRRNYEYDDDRGLSWETRQRIRIGLSPVIRPNQNRKTGRMSGFKFLTLGLLGLALAAALALLLEKLMGGGAL
jgi:hypothetical protein